MFCAPRIVRPVNRFLLLSLGLACAASLARADTETIVFFRHGEKTAHELGQLSVIGLNRSLALPSVLLGKFGKPDYLFAPDPDRNLVGGRHGEASYDYVRPLATIEPTAIELGMPINTHFGFKEIGRLETELMKPAYRNALIFVCWEHGFEDQLAKRMMEDLGGPASDVPDWPSGDYDSLFVIRIERSDGHTTATFAHDREGLSTPSARFPAPASP